jgi:SAM-dependent methyltransferase
MEGRQREDVCRHLADDKRRLGLPLLAVRGIDEYLRAEWNIAPPVHPSGWAEELARVSGADLYHRYRNLHDQRATYVCRGKEAPSHLDSRFYDLIADDRISGFIHSQKRVFILDAAALLVHLATRLEAVGPVLDVGCHIGYHAILLGRETGREVLGIDRSGPAIEAARRKTPPGLNIRFDTTPLKAGAFSQHFDFVYAVDSVAPIGNNLANLSRVLKPHGVLMLVNRLSYFEDGQFRRDLTAAGLGFGLADVIGGWLGEGREFAGTAVLVLIKGTEKPLPPDLRRQTEEGWAFFTDYANEPTTPRDEKTQAFFRGKYIDNHPAL